MDGKLVGTQDVIEPVRIVGRCEGGAVLFSDCGGRIVGAGVGIAEGIEEEFCDSNSIQVGGCEGRGVGGHEGDMLGSIVGSS